MIVNWKKKNAGVLVMPCVVKGLIVKKIFIVPGHNDILEEDWEMAKASAKYHIDAKNLVIFEKKVEVKKVESKKVASKKGEPVDFDALLTLDKFPYLDVAKAIKELDLYASICAGKKKADGKATLNKAYLLKYMQDNEEDWDLVTAKLYPADSEDAVEEEEEDTDNDEQEKYTAMQLTDMTSEEATDVIEETYCLKTLTKWKKEISQPDLRALIIDRMEVVSAPSKKNS